MESKKQKINKSSPIQKPPPPPPQNQKEKEAIIQKMIDKELGIDSLIQKIDRDILKRTNY